LTNDAQGRRQRLQDLAEPNTGLRRGIPNRCRVQMRPKFCQRLVIMLRQLQLPLLDPAS
jgi:hypothetical protein